MDLRTLDFAKNQELATLAAREAELRGSLAAVCSSVGAILKELDDLDRRRNELRGEASAITPASPDAVDPAPAGETSGEHPGPMDDSAPGNAASSNVSSSPLKSHSTSNKTLAGVLWALLLERGSVGLTGGEARRDCVAALGKTFKLESVTKTLIRFRTEGRARFDGERWYAIMNGASSYQADEGVRMH